MSNISASEAWWNHIYRKQGSHMKWYWNVLLYKRESEQLRELKWFSDMIWNSVIVL